MKRLLVLLLVGLAPLPVQAATCITGTVEWDSGSPRWSVPDVPSGFPVDSDIVGTFLWVQVDGGEVVSVELTETVIGAVVCDTGTVTLTHADDIGTALVLERIVLPPMWAWPATGQVVAV